MQDRSLDERAIKCPRCGRIYLGKNINNKYSSMGICDWCALTYMLLDAGVTKTPACTEVVFGENGPISRREIPSRPIVDDRISN